MSVAVKIVMMDDARLPPHRNKFRLPIIRRFAQKGNGQPMFPFRDSAAVFRMPKKQPAHWKTPLNFAGCLKFATSTFLHNKDTS